MRAHMADRHVDAQRAIGCEDKTVGGNVLGEPEASPVHGRQMDAGFTEHLLNREEDTLMAHVPQAMDVLPEVGSQFGSAVSGMRRRSVMPRSH